MVPSMSTDIDDPLCKGMSTSTAFWESGWPRPGEAQPRVRKRPAARQCDGQYSRPPTASVDALSI